MSLGKKSAAVILLLGCVGCAHMPDATVRYYLAKSNVSFKVLRSLACDPAGGIVVLDTVSSTVTHTADTSKAMEVRLEKLSGAFTDSDIKFELYEDGRLKSINATTTGQGEEILKTAVSIAAAAAGIRSKSIAALSDCDYIAEFGGDSDTLTLTYEGGVEIGKLGLHCFAPDKTSLAHAMRFQARVGDICAVVTGMEQLPAPVAKGSKGNDVLLTARQPGLAKIRVLGEPSGNRILWEGPVAVAQPGIGDYELPIPSAAVFGKRVFAATFDPSGALTMVQYAGSAGTGQVLNVVNSALAEIKSAAEKKAAALNAEASLIAAQQRLAKCRADPASCS